MTSDVVLRCPNCGTTQALRGECDACHENSVRFYCPNHAPGRWLDGPACAECAARSERERAPAATRAPAPPPLRRSPTPRDEPRDEPRAEVSYREPARDELARAERRVEPPRVDMPRIDVPPLRRRTPSPAELRDMLPRMLPDMMPTLTPELRARGLSTAMGCFKRLLVTGIILAILFAMATAWFFSGVVDLGAILGALPSDAGGMLAGLPVVSLRT